jgi:phosphate/sulfate permease
MGDAFAPGCRGELRISGVVVAGVDDDGFPADGRIQARPVSSLVLAFVESTASWPVNTTVFGWPPSTRVTDTSSILGMVFRARSAMRWSVWFRS